MAKRTIIGGAFQDAAGNALAGGKITFRLNTDAQVGTVQVSSGIVTSLNLDSNGDVSGVVQLWPNDQMTPSTAVYIMTVMKASGQVARSSQQVIPSGIGSYNLNTMIPTT